VYIEADLATRGACQAIIEKTNHEFGQIDILVNNAGIIRRSPAVEYSREAWDQVLAVDLSAVFELSQMAGADMLRRQSPGKIVNVASLLSDQGGINVVAYAAAKAGVAQFIRAFANEWAIHHINVNAIASGYIETNNTEALRQDSVRNRQILERIPAR